jgi:hypothetical protein
MKVPVLSHLQYHTSNASAMHCAKAARELHEAVSSLLLAPINRASVVYPNDTY